MTNSSFNKDDQVTERKKPNEVIAYKYSKKGKSNLYESVLLNGTPCFMTYDSHSNTLGIMESIEEYTRIIRPPHQEEYPYEPYEFGNASEMRDYFNSASNETIDSIYQKTKDIFTQFNDIEPNTIILLSADTLGSYFQDRFSTVHYLIIVGDNGTGKSSIGDTFESLGYRAVSITDATPATWYRVLGSIEPGQVTIIADEADSIGDSPEVMSILKTGYQPKGKVFRMDSDNKKQQFFYPYCMKIMIAEKSPGEIKAKGLLDRSFKIKTYKGFPQYDIKEVRNPQGNKDREGQHHKINSLRKLLLMFKLLHFKDPLPEVDVGLNGRDKELCKPILQLLYGLGAKPETLAEIESAFQSFLEIKNDRKKNSLEAVIYPIITRALSKYGNEIETKELWISILESLEGEGDANKPNIFYSSEYGKIYRNTITKMICDKFGAEKKHKENGNVLIFNDYVHKVGKLYSNSKIAHTRLRTDPSDSSDASRTGEQAFELSNDNTIKNSHDFIKKSREKSELASMFYDVK